MYRNLEELSKLNQKMNAIVAEAKICNKKLQEEYKRKEFIAVEKFLCTLKQLAFYAKNISYANGFKGVHLDTEISLDFYRGSYGKNPNLYLVVNEHGNFQLKADPSGYSCRPTIYDSETNKWTWEEERCRKFIALHRNEILDVIQRKIEEELQSCMINKMENVMARQNQLILLIDAVQ